MTLKGFITQQAVAGALINAVLNGLFAYAALQGAATWPLWGLPSIFVDTLAMAFGIAFGTGLLLTPQLRKQIATGKVVPPELPARWHQSLSQWPVSALQRGMNLGVVGTVIFSVPVIALFVAFDFSSIGRDGLAIYKALFGLVEGGIVTPIVALGAVSDALRAREAGAVVSA
jgi:hypothetical protein